jgi:hypothetical protein
MGSFDFKGKPTGVWKWFLHAPTWLFRARLGFLMGKRMIMIEHRGRRRRHLHSHIGDRKRSGLVPQHSGWRR